MNKLPKKEKKEMICKNVSCPDCLVPDSSPSSPPLLRRLGLGDFAEGEWHHASKLHTG